MIPHHATALNLASVLEHQARLTPDRVAVTFGSTHITYGELDAGASQIAGGLLGLGIAPGDHVALSCPNVPWFPIAYFGILKAGAVVVPLNVLLKPREIAYHLRDSDAQGAPRVRGHGRTADGGDGPGGVRRGGLPASRDHDRAIPRRRARSRRR